MSRHQFPSLGALALARASGSVQWSGQSGRRLERGLMRWRRLECWAYALPGAQGGRPPLTRPAMTTLPRVAEPWEPGSSEVW